MQETQVPSLGQEDPLEKERTTHPCLQSPKDGGAWRAAVHCVTEESDTIATKQQQLLRRVTGASLPFIRSKT